MSYYSALAGLSMNEHTKEDDDSFESMKGNLLRPYPARKMSGETIEMLEFCKSVGAYVEFTISFGKKPLVGLVKRVNRSTGRLTFVGGYGKDKWVHTILLKNVKMFTYSEAAFDEWEKSQKK